MFDCSLNCSSRRTTVFFFLPDQMILVKDVRPCGRTYACVDGIRNGKREMAKRKRVCAEYIYIYVYIYNQLACVYQRITMCGYCQADSQNFRRRSKNYRTPILTDGIETQTKILKQINIELRLYHYARLAREVHLLFREIITGPICQLCNASQFIWAQGESHENPLRTENRSMRSKQ